MAAVVYSSNICHRQLQMSRYSSKTQQKLQIIRENDDLDLLAPIRHHATKWTFSLFLHLQYMAHHAHTYVLATVLGHITSIYSFSLLRLSRMMQSICLVVCMSIIYVNNHVANAEW